MLCINHNKIIMHEVCTQFFIKKNLICNITYRNKIDMNNSNKSDVVTLKFIKSYNKYHDTNLS